jgi:tetratricopeptide (TPR) repeat protein
MQKARDRMPQTSWHWSITVLTVWLLLLGAGCAGVRPARSPAELLALRQEHDAQMAEKALAFRQRIVERLKARYDTHPAAPVIYDILVLSGGGDWGAFGAGFLKGWSHVQGPLAMPEFDVVTGVSTGALIAPFAFLGDAQSLDTNEAYALHLLGEIAARRNPPEVASAEASYQQALALANELSMRPLQAHCHHSLGTLYSRVGREQQAHAALSTAIALYRAMGMTFWLPQAETALAQVEAASASQAR